MFGNDVEFIEPTADPLQSPSRRRKKHPWIIIIGVALLLLCGAGFWQLRNAFAANNSPTATATEAGAGLPNPNVRTELPNYEATYMAGTAESLFGALSSSATIAPTQTPTNTAIFLKSNTPTAENFLTQQVYDDLMISATYAAAAPGVIINQANPFGVTTVYIYPSQSPTPWIVSATPTATDRIIRETVEVIRIVTATPMATQTPWFYITQPPIVTVMWTREVEVTRLVTVVVTATETETMVPSETPAPTETPTSTETATP